MKGYARALDLARLMHALHAAILELDLDVWFEYVRTAANIADEPSRVDMGTEVFDIAAMVPEVHAMLAGSLSSVPVPVVFPTRHDWVWCEDGWL